MKPGGLLPLVSLPEISVIMPVFNGAAFLDRAVRSLQEQSFANWELLASDDCSSDDSYERLRAHAGEDLRIHALRLPTNRGPSAARNWGLMQARGKFITYLDCDDEYYADYLSQVMSWQGRTEVCLFNYDRCGEGAGPPGRYIVENWDPGLVAKALLQHNITCPLGVAHRRDLLDRVGYFDESIWYEEDWDLWKRFARAGARFMFSPVKSGRYYVRSESLSRTRRTPDAVKHGSQLSE